MRLLPMSLVIIVSVLNALPASAQWAAVKTKGVPVGKDGRPDLTAPAPKKAGGKIPDLAGVWYPVTVPCEGSPFEAMFGCSDALLGIPIGVIDVTSTKPEEIESGTKEGLPYRPWALELAKQNMEQQGKDDPSARCLPLSIPRSWPDFTMQKIVHTDDLIVILNEYMTQYRQIHLDGRPLPKDAVPQFKGYSVGRWEGDTLVVDSIGFKDGWLDLKGNPITEEARTTERIRRVDYGTLEVTITIDDPKAYTKPFTVKRYLKLKLDTELIDYICNENEKSLQHMVGK